MPQSDPVARREYMRQYKKNNPARTKIAAKFYDAAKHANQRADNFGVSGHLMTAQVRAILEGSECHYCGSQVKLGLDHVIPMSDGGPNVPSNIVPCCHSCNASKWRQDRPGRWSRKHDACVNCGTSDRPHLALGLCQSCHTRQRRQREFVALGGMSERDFQRRVIEAAQWHGWLVHHCRPARRANGTWETPIEGSRGFVDLVLAKNGRVLFWELKGPRGRLGPGQQEWLDALGPQARVWTPNDWPQIVAELASSPVGSVGAAAPIDGTQP